MKAAGFLDFGTELVNPDFSKLAEAAGLLGLRAERPEQVKPMLTQALEHDGPALVDAVVNRQELSMPPSITVEVKGFTLYMIKAVLSGRGDEVLDLAKTNLLRRGGLKFQFLRRIRVLLLRKLRSLGFAGLPCGRCEIPAGIFPGQSTLRSRYPGTIFRCCLWRHRRRSRYPSACRRMTGRPPNVRSLNPPLAALLRCASPPLLGLLRN